MVNNERRLVKREEVTFETSLECAVYGISFVLSSVSPTNYQINIRGSIHSGQDFAENGLKKLNRPMTRAHSGVNSARTRENSSLISFNTPEHRTIFNPRRKDLTAQGGDLWHTVNAIGVNLEKIKLGSGNELHYNDIVCLAGDLYESFEQLETDGDIQFLLLHYETIEASGVGGAVGNMFWSSFIKEDGAANKVRSYTAKYILYASRNFAHFRIPYKLNQFPTGTPPDTDKSGTPNAVEAYKSWHGKAQKIAYDAGLVGSQAQLTRAFAMNAFADHFLEDLFSCGHMRVPRREINYAITSGENPLNNLDAGLSMHDEDNLEGLFVKCLCDCPGTEENHGVRFVTCTTPWAGKGDSYLKYAPTHAQKADTAVHISVYEIKDAYQAGQKHDNFNPHFHIVQHLPMPYPPGIGKDQIYKTDPWDPQYIMKLGYAPSDPLIVEKAILRWASNGNAVEDFVRPSNTFPRFVVDAKNGAIWERLYGTVSEEQLTGRYLNYYVPFKK